MRHRTHLILSEREDMMVLRREGKSVTEIAAITDRDKSTVTLDRGKEFALHGQITEEISIGFYFALPRHPWQRGTDENTNGLLREYFPKDKSLARATERQVREVHGKLNRRPRKRLGCRTPYEAHYSVAL